MRVEGSAYRTGGGFGEGVPLPRGVRSLPQRRERTEPAFPRVDLTDDRPQPIRKGTKKVREEGPRERRSDAGIPKRELTQDERQAIVDAYVNDGVPIAVIATRHRMGVRRVRQALVDSGIVIVRRSMTVEPVKTCEVCNSQFHQGEMRNDAWLKRTTCTRRCAGLLAAKKRLGRYDGQ